MTETGRGEQGRCFLTVSVVHPPYLFNVLSDTQSHLPAAVEKARCWH